MSTALQINSVEDIERLARPRVLVYNPDESPDEVEVAGHFYKFPARGTCAIGDQYTYEHVDTPTGRKADFSRRVLSNPAVKTALAIVEPAIRGYKGFCVLLGDGRDEQRKAEADRVWREWRTAQALVTQADWLQKCDAATKEPGAVPPVQTLRVRQDLSFLARVKGDNTSRLRYVCLIDSFESDDLAEVQNHMRTMYPGENVETRIRDTRAGQKADVPKPSPEGEFLIARALELGVSLSVGDRKGLTFGDADVTADVMTRLGAAEDKPKGKQR